MFNRGKDGAAGRGWRPIAGFTWEVFCIGVAWAVAYATIPLVLLPLARGAELNTLVWTAFWAYFLFTFKLTGWLSDRYRERQRRNVVSAQELLSRDPRPHVLYLRPFQDDETTSRLLDLSSEEQELATVMLEIGPFVALGEPGEAFPDPGAARLYVEEESWRSKAEQLMSSARLVVARAGNTDNFWWEMSRAVELVKPERLLLLVPEDGNVYEAFRQRGRSVFPRRLPEHAFPSSRSSSFRSLEGVLYFGPDWTPHLLRFGKPALRNIYWAPGVSVLKTALRPVYEQLGVEWKRPPLQPVQVLPVVMLLLFGVFTVYVAALQVVRLFALFR